MDSRTFDIGNGDVVGNTTAWQSIFQDDPNKVLELNYSRARLGVLEGRLKAPN